MSEKYRIFGAEVSPYSVKVRSYFLYKKIPHEWIVRDSNSMPEYQRYARLPIIPVVVTPEGEGLQDSTPIIEAIEQRVPEPSIYPADDALRFLSELLEEFGDEWGNKWMFHYRWAREVDQESAAARIAEVLVPDASDEERARNAAAIRERMVGRGWVIGSNEQTAPIIEGSFRNAMDLLEAHLEQRSFLFGERPAFGDFGLWGQVYNAWTDPTPGGLLRARHPRVCQWIDRMLDPVAIGEFESWQTLRATLEPFLRQEVAPFLRWSDANARALEAGAEEFSVDLDGRAWRQTVGGPQKYHAKSLRELRRKYRLRETAPGLREVLEATGCLAYLG